MTIDAPSSPDLTLISYPIRAVCSPQADYVSEPIQKDLQDQLEDHLALYHYHQAALLELASSEFAPQSNDWEYGAYLMGESLLQRSGVLLEQLASS